MSYWKVTYLQSSPTVLKHLQDISSDRVLLEGHILTILSYRVTYLQFSPTVLTIVKYGLAGCLSFWFSILFACTFLYIKNDIHSNQQSFFQLQY